MAARAERMHDTARTPIRGPEAAPAAAAGRRLVLASASPRRRELMGALRAAFEAVPPNGAETPPRSGEAPENFVMRLSLSKARAVSRRVGDAIVVGADTAVVVDGVVLGKPVDPEDAVAMLARLRGRTHRVVTGVTVFDGASADSRTICKSTDVLMRQYSDEEISAYVASGDPLDKAGGYAVQDVAFRPADSMDGCYLNVVGLPLCETVTLLAEIGADIDLKSGWWPPAECADCPLSVDGEVGR